MEKTPAQSAKEIAKELSVEETFNSRATQAWKNIAKGEAERIIKSYETKGKKGDKT